MAQAGFHGLIGLAGAAVRRDEQSPVAVSGAWKFGFVLGNLLPDADFFLLGPMFLVNSAAARTLHRSFSHSFLTIGVLTMVLTWLARGRSDRRSLAFGLGLGMVLHSLVDIFVWFSGVNVLWPLGYLGVPSEINLWAMLPVPGVVSSLLGAVDYLAFALFFLYLGRLAKRLGTNGAFLPRLRFFGVLNLTVFVVYSALAFLLKPGLFEIAHYALFILAFFPICLYVTVKMRPTIEKIGSPSAVRTTAAA